MCADNQAVVHFMKGGLPGEYVMTDSVPVVNIFQDIRFFLDRELETTTPEGQPLKVRYLEELICGYLFDIDR